MLRLVIWEKLFVVDVAVNIAAILWITRRVGAGMCSCLPSSHLFYPLTRRHRCTVIYILCVCACCVFVKLYKVKRHKELKSSLPALRERLNEGEIGHASMVDIQATRPGSSFFILLDDVLFGPFRRVRIRPSKLGNSNLPLRIPISTFTPIDCR